MIGKHKWNERKRRQRTPNKEREIFFVFAGYRLAISYYFDLLIEQSGFLFGYLFAVDSHLDNVTLEVFWSTDCL